MGLIILDEEQEHTYQSESAPRYSAHDVAKKRAMMEHSLLLFSSATPRTETLSRRHKQPDAACYADPPLWRSPAANG